MSSTLLVVDNHSGELSGLGAGDATLVETSGDAMRYSNLSIVKDRFGFFVNEKFHQYIEIPESERIKRKLKEGERALKWIKMTKQWSKYTSPDRYEKLKRRVRKGIPDAVRGYVWYHLGRCEEAKATLPALEAIDIAQLSPVVIDEVKFDSNTL
jgi:hypothetical protein